MHPVELGLVKLIAQLADSASDVVMPSSRQPLRQPRSLRNQASSRDSFPQDLADSAERKQLFVTIAFVASVSFRAGRFAQYAEPVGGVS